jgi:SAM-dependent methyltransferase
MPPAPRPEQPWSEGYVVDIDYTHGFYRELAPSLLRFVTALHRVQAADTDRPFTYYELGCGNGNTTALLAAVNPHGRFTGVDFNPAHVAYARKLAQDTGVGNATFLEHSFGDLAGLDTADAEIIALHGVYSWVSEENRRHIVEFIRRRLKAGGIVYVSYNCLPGFAQAGPLQRLFVEHAGRGEGELADRVRRSVQFATLLAGAGAEYFHASPVAKRLLQKVGGEDLRYVAHEYFGANWSPLFHADVARELAAASLSYAGSAVLLDNFDQLMLKPELQAFAADAADRAFAETVRDFAVNRSFRRDVYVRDAPAAGPADAAALLGRTRFALARPRALCRLKRRTPAGDVALEEHSYAPVLDALARAPMTVDELSQAPECAALDPTGLRQAVLGMAAFANILPALPAAGDGARRASAARFNHGVLSRPIAGVEAVALASPVLGSGVAVSVIDSLLLAGLAKGGDPVNHAAQAFLDGGLRLLKAGEPVKSADEARDLIAGKARFFFSQVLPHFRQLGVVE